jgi:hypothetical protein
VYLRAILLFRGDSWHQDITLDYSPLDGEDAVLIYGSSTIEYRGTELNGITHLKDTIRCGPNLYLSTGHIAVKAYLVTTGTLFGLIAVMHLLKSIDEWPRLTTDPLYYLGTSALGVVAAALSVWAWRLLRLKIRT